MILPPSPPNSPGPSRPPAAPKLRADLAARAAAAFNSALDRPAGERAAFVAGACAGEVEMYRHVQRLLAAHDEAGEFLDEDAPLSPEIEAQLAALKPEEAGERIGPYKLLEQIGEGGFGTVWVADQERPVRRRVALKIIKMGMDTKEVISRFEQERQALAMMDHPHIAKVFDAGATQWGRPFFVMELVRGVKITDYCDEQQLSTPERIELFITVCRAVQHAHQKGIIHRDLKPSNILVTINDGKAVPKVIDFGVAKATQGRLTDGTIYTQFQQMIGTPLYMSPEQAELTSLDIDTRSDIYSLGVLLYELLTGRTPIDNETLRHAGMDEIRRLIREVDPPRLSMRVKTLDVAEMTTVAKHRHTEPAKLPGALRGDLDWVVMKCLEKDRTRRYDTANGLAMDLQRHLKNEVVIARPPTAGYLLGKLIRRHKLAFGAGATVIASLVLVAFAAGAAVMVSLVLGITAATWMYFRENAARKRATDAEKLALTDKANAEAALHFIQEDVLSQASPGYQPNRELTVHALLDRIVGRLDRAGRRSPLVEASIRQTLGSVYTELGDYAKAVEHFETALRIQREHLGESHVNTLWSLNGLVGARLWGGETSLAEPLTRQGLAASRRALGEKHPLTLQFMQTRAFVVMLLAESTWTEIEAQLLRTLALHREVLGPDDPGTLRLIYGLSLGCIYHGEPGKAEPLVADALDRSRRVLGEKHPITSSLTASLANDYRMLNRLEKAEALALRAVELRISTLGEDHPHTMSSVCNLAMIYVMQQQFDKAGPLTEQALDLSRRMKKSVFSAWNLSNLGWVYLEQGDVARAANLCDLGLQAMRRNPAFNPVASPRIIANLGAVRFAQQNYAEAGTLLREGLRLAEKHDSDAGYRFYWMNLLGANLAGQKNYTDAEPLLLQSCQGLQQHQASLPPYLNAPRRITESLERLVQLYDACDKPAQAAEWKQKLDEFQQAAKAVEKKGPQP